MHQQKPHFRLEFQRPQLYLPLENCFFTLVFLLHLNTKVYVQSKSKLDSYHRTMLWISKIRCKRTIDHQETRTDNIWWLSAVSKMNAKSSDDKNMCITFCSIIWRSFNHNQAYLFYLKTFIPFSVIPNKQVKSMVDWYQFYWPSFVSFQKMTSDWKIRVSKSNRLTHSIDYFHG